MIFTHIHQFFLHEHSSSVFTGNKVTDFKSRSPGLNPGQVVRMGAVVCLRLTNLGMLRQQWVQNLLSLLGALRF